MKLGDFAITEAGFGFDLGAEKFFDTVSRKAGFAPDAVVLVATIRALKLHGGKKLKELEEEDPVAIEKGFENLEKHYENILYFGVPAIVAINAFDNDSKAEVEKLVELLESKNIPFEFSRAWKEGGNGTKELAKKVKELTTQKCTNCKPIYPLDMPVEDKIFHVAHTIYGAAKIDFTREARSDLKTIKKLGLENLPVCIAKTQKSLSDNPALLGRPKDFLVTVRKIEISSGAGFLVPITGDIMRMPGLPKTPAYKNINIDNNGNIYGLF